MGSRIICVDSMPIPEEPAPLNSGPEIDLSDMEISQDQLLTIIEGVDIETARKNSAFREELNHEASYYINLLPEQWPSLQFNWDLSASSQRFALDGEKEESFQKSYPNRFELGWVDLAEFDSHLSDFTHRKLPEELWTTGFPDKLARAVAYLARGLPIAPPLAHVLEDGKIIFHGGNHRYAAAKASDLRDLPVYATAANMAKLKGMMRVRDEPKR